MATNNYQTMSNEALEALLENSDFAQDHAQIEQILINRDNEFDEGNEDFEDMEGAHEAEAEMQEDAEELAEKQKLEQEERDAKIAEMTASIGKKVMVFNVEELEWEEGYLHAILNDKRAKNPMYSVKVGKTTVRRAYGSNQIEVTDENHPDYVPRAERTTSARVVAPKLTEAEVNEIKLNMELNLGKLFEHPERGLSVIIGITHDKRHDTLMYRCRANEDNKNFNITYSNDIIQVAFVGEDESIVKRNESRINYAKEILANPLAKYKFMQDELESVEAQIAKLQARKDELDAQLDGIELE